jgi:putative endonuclease
MFNLLTFWRRLFGIEQVIDVSKLSHNEFGSWSEKTAEKYLSKIGMKLLARNFSSGHGEIDLVMRDKETLVFVEVKSARDLDSEPRLKVNQQKRRRLLSAANGYIKRYRMHDCSARFDIVVIKVGNDGAVVIEHTPDAFYANDQYKSKYR